MFCLFNFSIFNLLQDMGDTLRLPVTFVIIEFIGTFAFAISGVRLSSTKQFDIFGAWIVGMATAIGGGTIRDLMLGVNPFWMTNGSYFVCCALAVLAVGMFGKYIIHHNYTWFIFDTIGLALFNVVGLEKALTFGHPYWVAITMGAVTGAGGGIIRDVLMNDVPLIFRSEIYALACVAGGLAYVTCIELGLSVEISALLSAFSVILIRILAVKYHWQLPVLKGESKPDNNESSILRVLVLLLTIASCPLSSKAQVQQVFNSNIKTLTLTVDDDPTLPPFLQLRGRQSLCIEWDEMSHDYKRYRYHIDHCNWDWQPTDDIFESDFLEGLNDQLIEDYEKSFNTTQIYTHYRLRIPNKEIRLRLSGNYRVQIYEENEKDEPVLEARFCIYEREMGIVAQLSSNTDVDFNNSHHQMTLSIGYGSLQVYDPQRELKVIVMQNRRWESRVENLVPNILKANGIEFTHNRNLIFPAGNEYHRFEILDVHRTNAGVDRIDWFEPYYHATLFAAQIDHSYTYFEDQNGVYVVRSSDNYDDWTTAEYVVVHFFLETPRLEGGDVYVSGWWAGQTFNPDCKMEYDEVHKQYHAAILLKQGYYSYEFIQKDGLTRRTMGSFFETENEYEVLVYYRQQGSRYDRLAGFNIMHNAR
jgi:uncharacterized membrane protein YeiH